MCAYALAYSQAPMMQAHVATFLSPKRQILCVVVATFVKIRIGREETPLHFLIEGGEVGIDLWIQGEVNHEEMLIEHFPRARAWPFLLDH